MLAVAGWLERDQRGSRLAQAGRRAAPTPCVTTATMRPFTSTDHAYVYETDEDEHSVDEDLKEDKLERTPIAQRVGVSDIGGAWAIRLLCDK